MAEERVQRRLAAILAADVVGYSRLMEADEEATLRTLKTYREIIDRQIDSHDGRVFNTAGDSVVAEFRSPVEAVRAAIAIQEELKPHNDELSDEGKMMFRIGINLGDIMVEGDNLYGDGVNVAARIEGLCAPGEVYVSGIVHGQVEGKLSLNFEDMGEQSVKNIGKPVQVYRVHTGTGENIPQDAIVKPLLVTDKPSIAVLPFDNMSNDPEQEYFSDGITEDIITALSRIHWFFVVARNSSFSYKGTTPDIRKVANELGVRYVLEGSVRKAGNRVRISAKLIDGSTGNHLWAERYDRELEDIFAVQDEITRTVVGAIEPELADAEIDKARRSPPNDLDAWDCYQRGKWHFYSRTPDDLDRAQDLFDQAVALDPTLAVAYAAAAMVHYYQTTGVGQKELGNYLEDGLRMARKAVELDDEDASAHVALGLTHIARSEGEQARLQFKKAVDLNPSDGHAIRWLATSYSWFGEPETAIPLLETSIEVSPRDPLVGPTMVRMAECYHFLGDYENAVTWGRRALLETSTRSLGHMVLISALALLGHKEEAEKALPELRRLRPEMTCKTVVREGDAPAHWPENYLSAYIEGLRKAGLPD